MTLHVGAPAHGGSCVARHDGRVVFVRYALPGERVRARITARRDAYWHAETLDVLEPSADRIASACPIAGVHGAGCCDLAFVAPAAARALKAEVVSDQLARLGGQDWHGEAEPLGTAGPTGWRRRVRLEAGGDGRAGFHRYHSAELVCDLRCAQLPAGMTDALPHDLRPGTQVHVVVDDDDLRHVVTTGHHRRPHVAERGYRATHRVGRRHWRVPVTAFWQPHRDAARRYSDLVADWAQLDAGATAWDLYGGAGVFAAALGEAVGATGRVLTVDTARASSAAARTALADLDQVRVVTDSVRRTLASQRAGADVAVLDPPRSGAGRGVIDALAAAAVPRVVHFGCDVATFARDLGLYRGRGYRVERLRVFDAFPLTHHVECVALLSREM